MTLVNTLVSPPHPQIVANAVAVAAGVGSLLTIAKATKSTKVDNDVVAQGDNAVALPVIPHAVVFHIAHSSLIAARDAIIAAVTNSSFNVTPLLAIRRRRISRSKPGPTG